ncbi:MAG: DUF4269 domain-containing protein [bacterium]
MLALRGRGMKTEPAFAACFGLRGDPYRALLDLEALNEQELERMIRREKSLDL